jgi:hypothetical protein
MTRYALAAAAAFLAGGAAHAASTAVSITPERFSVEAGSAQLVAVKFLDAAGHAVVGETAQFSNDACGTFPNGTFVMNTTTDASGVASLAFTAMQPGGTVCAMLVSAGSAAARFQVFTYRLSQVAISAAPPEHPTPGAMFTLPVQVRMGNYVLPNVDVTARVIGGAGGGTVTASANTGASGTAQLEVQPSGAGDFEVEVALRTLTRRVPIHFEDPVVPVAGGPHQDLWWAGAAENGWGVSIIEHRDVLFILIYAYDEAGRPTWYVISNGTWSGRAYTGALYSPRGTPFYAYDASRWTPGPALGTAIFTFIDGDNATLDYSISGVSGRKSISRLAFGAPASAAITGRTDMWWGGAAQNGWGLAIVQQNAALFTMWFTYDAAGLPTWLVMSSGAWTGTDSFEGRIHRATGSPWLGRAYDATRFAPVDVGSFRLRFSGETTTLDYIVDGRAGVLSLTRTPF